MSGLFVGPGLAVSLVVLHTQECSLSVVIFESDRLGSNASSRVSPLDSVIALGMKIGPLFSLSFSFRARIHIVWWCSHHCIGFISSIVLEQVPLRLVKRHILNVVNSFGMEPNEMSISRRRRGREKRAQMCAGAMKQDDDSRCLILWFLISFLPSFHLLGFEFESGRKPVCYCCYREPSRCRLRRRCLQREAEIIGKGIKWHVHIVSGLRGTRRPSHNRETRAAHQLSHLDMFFPTFSSLHRRICFGFS